MAIKKIVKKKKKTKRRKKRKVTDDVSGLKLPKEMKEVDADLTHYTILGYGREKIGKSTWFSAFPEAIFFATEPGTKGLEIFELNHEDGGVRNWSIFRKGVDLLVKNKGKFQTVVVDTVDRAYDMCLDWVCETRGIEYPGQDASGKQDFGKSWRAVKSEFVDQIHRLAQAGYGICFVSHVKEIDIVAPNGETYTRIMPSMSGQAKAVVEALVDFFFYAEYVRDKKGRTQRIWICEGDDLIWAGARSAGGIQFPKFLPLEKEGGYDTLVDAFSGEFAGVDIEKLSPSRLTSGTGEAFLKRERLKKKRKAKKKVKPKKKGGKR